jgi:uncharacterized membrane protein
MAIKLKYWLVGSLALNAALIGVVGGRMFSRGEPAEIATSYQAPGWRPISLAVQDAWSKLPESDRIELGAQFKVLNRETETVSARLKESASRIADMARQEPFDSEALRDTVVVYRHLQSGLQERVDDTLVGHLGKMPPDAREVAARGLLTPYYAWMKPRTPPPTDETAQR